MSAPVEGLPLLRHPIQAIVQRGKCSEDLGQPGPPGGSPRPGPDVLRNLFAPAAFQHPDAVAPGDIHPRLCRRLANTDVDAGADTDTDTDTGQDSGDRRR